jgi:hypothetical protein
MWKRRDISGGVEARIGASLKLFVEQFDGAGPTMVVEGRSVKKNPEHLAALEFADATAARISTSIRLARCFGCVVQSFY